MNVSLILQYVAHYFLIPSVRVGSASERPGFLLYHITGPPLYSHVYSPSVKPNIYIYNCVILEKNRWKGKCTNP